MGAPFLSDFPLHARNGSRNYPLVLCLCADCDLLQLAHDPPKSLWTEHYWYKSGIQPVIVEDLKNIVDKTRSLIHPRTGVWVDIGANDGTLLKFVPDEFKRIAFEPAMNLAPDLTGLGLVMDNFWSYEKYRLLTDEKALVITAIAVLYDLANPNTFIQDVRSALRDDGVFVAQLMTAQPMIQKKDVGNICHEHVEYYSWKSIKQLYEQNGLEIFSIEFTATNGGSYRLYARHKQLGTPIQINENLDFVRFFLNIEANKKRTVAFIREQAANGKKVYACGASTKGNTILQYYGLGSNEIHACADRNPEKWGRYMVGSWVPIVSEEAARADADYFFVLPWAFLDAFKEREKAWRDKGGLFITSTPEFQVC